MQRWRAHHPERREKKRAEDRAHYARYSERIRARTVEYHRTHPDVRRSAGQRRRARVAGAVGRFTAAEWRALLEACGDQCAYCGGPGPFHVEHRIPLARGGSNSIDNILRACGRCNVRKHTLTEEEFRERLRREGVGRSSEVAKKVHPTSRPRR